MELPYFKDLWDVTPIIVRVSSGNTDEDGAEIIEATYDGKCNYQESHKSVRSKEGSYVKLSGIVRIGADIAPSLAEITGEADINGVTYKIHKSTRPRNPSGTINHTKLELM